MGSREYRLDDSAAVDVILNRATYIRWYDAIQTDPRVLSVADLALPAFLGAVPNFSSILKSSHWEILTSALSEATELLSEIPSDRDLDHWDDSQANRELLSRLFRATTGGRNGAIPGFGPARATKMLHKKRPRLIPIIDSYVMTAHDMPASSWATDAMVDVVYAIRSAVASERADLIKLQRAVARADSTLPYLSTVRLHDILFWETISRDGNGGTL